MSTQTESHSPSSPVARANAARNASIRQIIEKHKDEYESILREERKARGLFGVLPGEKPKSKQQQLDEALQELATMRAAMMAAGIAIGDENGQPTDEQLGR